jgi:RNA polymerase sigma factor (sigma-70 family)
MPAGPLARVVQFCRSVLAPESADAAADAHLLELFVQRQDEAAFAALLHRHGPMVFGVCRRILGNSHDAEDAFQAVFLVLTRKAASIRPRRMVGNWLYGVAFRTALEARKAAARRQVKERHYHERRQAEQGDEMDEELLAILDEELHRLPDRYRAVLVLCDLEALTRKEAAQQLGCKEGTIASRLDRGRKLLAKRLTRRGLIVSGAVLVTALSAQAAQAAVPPALLAGAVQTSTHAGGGTAGGLLSKKVVALAERVLRVLWLRRLKSVLGLVLGVVIVALVLGIVVFRAGAALPSLPNAPPPESEAGNPDPEGEGNLTAKGLLHEEKLPLPVHGVAFSPDGKYLATATGRRGKDGAGGVGAVAVIELESWKEVTHLQEGFTDAVTAVAFAPDNARLAAGSMRRLVDGNGNPFDRPRIHLWSIRDNREDLPPLEIPRAGCIEALTFSLDGLRLAVAQSGQRAGVFDLQRRAETLLSGPAAAARRIEFSPNGKLLGLLGYGPPVEGGRAQPLLQLWDPATGRTVAGWKLAGKEVGQFQFAPRGGLLAATCDEQVILIDRKPEGGDRVIPLADVPRALAFAPGGRNLAIALTGGDVVLLDGRTGDIRQKYAPDPAYPLVSSVALSPDGSLLAIGSGKEDGGGMVRLWRGPRVTLPGWGLTVNPDGDCTIAPEGNTLVIGLPPAPHDLSAELARMNAPRVLEEVEGDFRVQVKVCGVLRPTARGTVPGRVPYQAGGLLLWGDNRNYVRLERAAMQRDGAIASMVAFEMRVKGEMAGARATEVADQDTYLRLERHGNQVLGWVSADGQQWRPLEPLELALPAKVRVGVAAVNAARQPLSIRYEEYQIDR